MKRLILLILILILSQQLVAQNKNVILTVPSLGHPISYVDEFGKPSGFFIELAQRMLHHLGYGITYKFGTFAECLEMVKEGEADLITMTMYLKERDEYLDFASEKMYSSWSLVMINRNSDIEKITDLRDKRIGVMRGDANAEAFRNFVKMFDINVIQVEFDSFKQIEDAISAQTIDAGVATSLYNILNPDIVVSNILFNPTQTFAAVTEGRNAELLYLMDEELREIKADTNSYYYEIKDKYFIYGVSNQLPTWVIVLIIVVLTIALFSILLVRLLKTRVDKKTKELRENEDILVKAERVAKFGNWIYDINTNKVHGSIGAKSVFGLPEDSNDFNFDYIQSMRSEEYNNTVNKALDDLVKYNKPYDIETKVVRLDGKIIDIHTIAEFDPKTNKVFGTIQDVTELKSKTNEIKKIITYLPIAFAYHEMIYDGDKPIDYRYIETNDNFYKMTGYPPMNGKLISEHVGKDVAKIWADKWYNNMKSGIIVDEVFDSVSNKWFSTTVYSTDDNKFVVMFNDITESKNFNLNLEKLIKERSEKLIESEKMASLGRMVAGLAHEINTPIGVALTASSFLSDKSTKIKDSYYNNTLDEGMFIDYIDINTNSSGIIVSNLIRASDLVKSLKELSIDQMVEEVRDINISDYVNTVITSLKPKFKNKNFICNIDVDNINIKINPSYISQLFSNLIINTIDHGFEDRDAGFIDIKVRCSKDEITINYKDDGCGIPDENKKQVLEPFFTTKRGKGFTGLGLNIIYKMVTFYFGGSIEINDVVPHGVEFIIKLKNNFII